MKNNCRKSEKCKKRRSMFRKPSIIEDEKPLRELLPEIFVSAIRHKGIKEKNKNKLTVKQQTPTLKPQQKADSICVNCGEEISDENKIFTYDDVYVGTGEVSATVMAVINKLRKGRNKRENSINQEQIDAIMDRVKDALKHSELNFDEPTDQRPTYDIEEQKQKSKDRTFVRESFEHSAELSRRRNKVISDMQMWLMDVDQDLSFFCDNTALGAPTQSDEHFHRMHKALRKSADAVNRLAKLLNASSARKKRPRTTLKQQQYQRVTEIMAEAGEMHQQAVNEIKPEQIKPIKRIFVEKELNEPKTIHKAFKQVTNVLEDGAKAVANPAQLHNNFKLAAKQFKILEKVLGRKIEKLKGMEDQLKKLGMEATNVKYLQEQKKKDTIKIARLTEDVTFLQNEVNFLEQNIQKMNKKMLSYNIQPEEIVINKRLTLLSDNTDGDATSLNDNTTNNITSTTLQTNIPKLNVLGSDSMNQVETKNVSFNSFSRTHSAASQGSDTNISMNGNQSPTESTMSAVDRHLASSLSNAPSAVSWMNESHMFDDDNASDVSLMPFFSPSEEGEKNSINNVQDVTEVEDDEQEEMSNYPQHSVDYPQQHSVEDISKKNESKKKSGLTLKLPQATTTITTTKKSSNTKLQKIEADNYERRIRTLQKLLDVAKQTSTTQTEELKVQKQRNNDLSLKIDKLKTENKTLKEQDKFELETQNLPRDQVLQKMQLSYQRELKCLRDYMANEQQRFQASLRKLQQEHDKYVAGLKNEKEQILRALVHFKKVVNGYISQTDNSDGNEKETTNPKEIEETVKKYISSSTNSIGIPKAVLEILVSLETSINKALIKKQLVLKHANAFKQTAVKSMQLYEERLQKTTQECKGKEKLAKQAIEENESMAKHHEKLSTQNERLEKELLPSQMIADKYYSLKKEVDRITRENENKNKEMNNTLKVFEADNCKLKTELQTMQQRRDNLFPSVSSNNQRKSNCLKKICLARKAYDNNEISNKQLQAVAEVLNQTNQYIMQQFRQLVQRYVEYKRIDTLHQNLVKIGKLYINQVRFNKYLARVEDRHNTRKAKWEEMKRKIRVEKDKSRFAFTALLNSPLEDSLQVSSLRAPLHDTDIPIATSNETKRAPPPRITHKLPIAPFSSVIGYKLPNTSPNASLWMMPPSSNEEIIISTPKIIELDINSWKQNTLFNGGNGKREVRLPPIASVFP